MKVLAIEKENPGITAGDFAPHLKHEARRVWELYQAGVIREMYLRRDTHEAILVLECTGEAEAKTHLGTLPLVSEGLIHFEIFPLDPYPGLSRLFAKGEEAFGE